ncbi:AAA family ATPase [Pseudonocardia sp. H11422]|uniref:AAA family ATPase n=1 Tax=Pseudonocardia sp. H11422 TaxID=2835866 RepID=UPI001BDD50F6|nr:MoxR family ATPase [Pseudonocardia sp. H11422]
MLAPDAKERIRELYGPEFLIERPLLRAIRSARAPVLLIDELDRADDEFEGFLLELLSDYTVTVPELGTLRAASTPMVIITSNRTRELHDALRRRCCFQWLDVPGPDREERIIRLRAPHVPAALASSVAVATARIRTFELLKPPGAAEAIDWANALAVLGADAVTSRAAQETLGWLLKNRDDVERVRAALPEVVVE